MKGLEEKAYKFGVFITKHTNHTNAEKISVNLRHVAKAIF
mgnify:CR=1 FL=1